MFTLLLITVDSQSRSRSFFFAWTLPVSNSHGARKFIQDRKSSGFKRRENLAEGEIFFWNREMIEIKLDFSSGKLTYF